MSEVQNVNIQILIVRSTLFGISRASESLPLRGGRWRRRRRMRANHTVKSLLKVILAMFAQRTEGFPLGGKKTAGSLSRKRLMRGDQSALTKAIHSPYAPCSPIGCEAARFAAFAPPNPPKNFPVRQPPHKERGKFPHTNLAVAVQGSSGRVREVWRGKKSPFKGVLPPPRSSPAPPRSFPYTIPCTVSLYRAQLTSALGAESR